MPRESLELLGAVHVQPGSGGLEKMLQEGHQRLEGTQALGITELLDQATPRARLPPRLSNHTGHFIWVKPAPKGHTFLQGVSQYTQGMYSQIFFFKVEACGDKEMCQGMCIRVFFLL